jgi:hypothetical protein
MRDSGYCTSYRIISYTATMMFIMINLRQQLVTAIEPNRSALFA